MAFDIALGCYIFALVCFAYTLYVEIRITLRTRKIFFYS